METPQFCCFEVIGSVVYPFACVGEHALDCFVDSPRSTCAIGASVFFGSCSSRSIPLLWVVWFPEGLFWVLLSGCLCVSLVSAFIFAVCSTGVSGWIALFVVITLVNALAILIVGIAGVVAPSLFWGFF